MPNALETRRRSETLRRRYLAAVPAIVIVLLAWYLAGRTPLPESRRAPSARTRYPPAASGCYDPDLTTLEPRERAAILVLLRAQDLQDLLPTLANFEHRFNAQFRYPYVFLTDPDEGDLPRSFRDRVEQALPVGVETEWGVVPSEHWEIPSWLDKDEIRRGFQEQEARGVQYAGREGYHHMCRWYSGLWARHPLLAKYEWYWRLEPGGTSAFTLCLRQESVLNCALYAPPPPVRFHCSITYDPFRFLAQHDKLYGFVITVVDQLNTMPTLIPTTLDYFEQRSGANETTSTLVPPSPDLWEFLMRKNGAGEYAACHFWTNFEVSRRPRERVHVRLPPLPVRAPDSNTIALRADRQPRLFPFGPIPRLLSLSRRKRRVLY